MSYMDPASPWYTNMTTATQPQSQQCLLDPLDQLFFLMYNADENEFMSQTVQQIVAEDVTYQPALNLNIHPAFTQEPAETAPYDPQYEIRPSRPRDIPFASSAGHTAAIVAPIQTVQMAELPEFFQCQATDYDSYMAVNHLANSFDAINAGCSNSLPPSDTSCLLGPIHRPVPQVHHSSYSELSANLQSFSPAVQHPHADVSPTDRTDITFRPYESPSIKPNMDQPPRCDSWSDVWPVDAVPPFLWPAAALSYGASTDSQAAIPSVRTTQRATDPPSLASLPSSSASSPASTNAPSPLKSKRASEVLKSLLDPKKPPKLACLFCRERKIACGASKEQLPCAQCKKRGLHCAYPKEYRRGIRGSRKNASSSKIPKVPPAPQS